MTVAFDYSVGTPPLAEAIDRDPLIASPDASLSDVVRLMNETARTHCNNLLNGARSSCVLVTQGKTLAGIFTERDLVQITALGMNLQTTKIGEVMHHPVLTISEQALHDIFAALFLFRRHRIRHLAIVDDWQHLVGVVSIESIRHILRPTNLLKIRRVAEVMNKQVVVAQIDTPVVQLTALMANHQISCIVIVNNFNSEDPVQHPVGIVTERDIVRFQALQFDVYKTLAQDVMSTPLFVLNPEDSLWTAHQVMEERKVRRLVVSWNWGQRLGIVTQTSIMRVFDPIEMHGVIETLQHTLQQLGLNIEQLEEAIDYDAHLPAASCSLDKNETDFKAKLSELQAKIAYLIKHPTLSSEVRQSSLTTALTDLQQIQSSLLQ
ncbi:MAG: CBS domain-containing protein [Leptolyngbyaceae cyanobacterium SM1_3_5]|nr:CBS domain-containing protein [Leptolyngbyaceae cyanobacterium SM1_3_5]